VADYLFNNKPAVFNMNLTSLQLHLMSELIFEGFVSVLQFAFKDDHHLVSEFPAKDSHGWSVRPLLIFTVNSSRVF